jgi:hypothetical protein
MMIMRRVFEFPTAVFADDFVSLYNRTDFFIDTMKLTGARSVDIMEDEPLDDGGRRWKARITDALKLPDFLKTPDKVVFINESAFHPMDRRLEWSIMPIIRQSFIQLKGEIRIQDNGDRARLVYDVSLNMNIPFLGKKTEYIGLQIIGRACADQALFAEERAAAIQSERFTKSNFSKSAGETKKC